jgi:hypothetical protein
MSVTRFFTACLDPRRILLIVENPKIFGERLMTILPGDNPAKRLAASGIAHKNHAENRAIYGV